MIHGFFNMIAMAIKPFAQTMYYSNLSRDIVDHVRGVKEYGEPRKPKDHSSGSMENDM